MNNQGFFIFKEQSGFSCGYSCKLNQGCRSPKMPVTGEGHKQILVVAEAPGADEDETGTQLIGAAGQYLRAALRRFKIDLDRDCRKTNAVRCRPPENRTPTREEILTCCQHIWDEIEARPPKLIITLGGSALESLIGDRWVKDLGGIRRWQGFTIPDHKAKAWLCPTWHPSYLNRIRHDKKGGMAIEPLFHADLKRALSVLHKPLPEPVFETQIELLFDPVKSARRILQLPTNNVYSVDFETTGLKPHREGHQIVCAAISSGLETFAFPLVGEVKHALAKFMQDPGDRKVAQHLQFESLWSSVILKARPRGWEWDTMLASHVLDNRPGVSGLKFQAFVNLGLIGYSDAVAPLLEAADPKDANSFNRVTEIPIESLIRYCGMDALAEFRLYEIQKELLEETEHE